jgi:dihydrofolate reductase
MRRIMMFNRITADGYFAAPDGKLDWAVPEEELEKQAVSNMPETGTILFGRRTYQMFAGFWPHALGDSPTSPDPHHPARRSPEMRAMATMLNESTKFVFSRTLKEVTWKNSRLLHEFDPREIEEMKQQPGKDMIIFGSGTIVSALTRHGLIDEYQFVVSPVFLGAGRLLLHDLAQSVKLELLDARPYKSGNVMLRYAPAR